MVRNLRRQLRLREESIPTNDPALMTLRCEHEAHDGERACSCGHTYRAMDNQTDTPLRLDPQKRPDSFGARVWGEVGLLQ